MAFWMGLMEIASKAGMIEKGAKMLKPFVRFLFPEVPEGHKAGEHITTNIIAKERTIIGLNEELLKTEALFSPNFCF